MGLDTSHNAWHGSYRSFHAFRKQLATHLGFNLEEMAGFGGEKPFSGDHVNILLSHSDCDGDISPEDCGKLAARLREILETIPKDDDPWSLYSHTEQFAKGCELAAKRNEILDFH